MRVILDTSTLLSYLLTRGKTNTETIIKLAKNNKLEIVYCTELITEVREKIATKKIKNYPTFKPNFNARFIAWLINMCTNVSISNQSSEADLRDVSDTYLIKLAHASKANYLITGDKDLLVLEQIGGTKITTPGNFLRLFVN